MNKYTGNFMGIVVQNSDPEKRGRVKVYVPHISVTLYNNWHETKLDKNFKFPDLKTNPDLTKVMGQLRDVLPWAECASPLFGGNAPGRYNALHEEGTTSDSNYWEGGELKDGNRPIQNFVGDNVYSDAFSEANKNGNLFTNDYAYQYTPSNYSNLARGMFTIPNVGAHLWVFFAEGDPNLPVYFAASHGEEDWKRIYTLDQEETSEYSSVDYPDSYENKDKTQKQTKNSQVFRAKTVYNSNKHSIELIDTDKREILKMTHFSGSFKEFCNHANIELATNNDQKMVVGDQFYTVQKNQSIYVGNTQDVIVVGDRYKTIGPKKYEIAEKILGYLKVIHEFKMLFNGKRTHWALQGDVSYFQTKAGVHANCPVCNNIDQTVNPNLWPKIQLWEIQPLNYLEPPPPASALVNINLVKGGPGFFMGSPCAVCNPLATGKPTVIGKSPSTQDGTWVPDPLKAPRGMLDILITSLSPKIIALQNQLGEGDEITTISKNKIENIGLVMNDMKSFRVDPIGKLRIDGVNVALEGVYPTFKTSPHVEYVDVDDVPGGDYNLTCGNKYKLLVGAKGINIKTFGPMDMYGTIVNLVGEQINISSQNEVLIDGGERFNIRARKISLIPIEHQPVVVDGQMHVTRNAVIGGGLFVEGEVGMLHMTAPYEYYATEPLTFPTPSLPPGDIAISNYSIHTHIIPPHTHMYKHAAITFLPAREAVRDSMRTQGAKLPGV